MKVTVLGSGTSHGVPVIGCGCAVCQSPDPRNKRYRPSVLVTGDGGDSVLIDTPPEMRLAFLANKVTRLDAILYTHSHADHIFGLDDVRTFNYRSGRAMPVYAEAMVRADVERIYDYVFKPTPKGGGKPQIQLNTIVPGETITVGQTDVEALRVYHGRLPILAYKCGAFAYVTDVSRIPGETWPHLLGLDVLMLDAVRREPHETHFHLDAALEVAEQLGARQTYLTHLSHDYDHAATNASLPSNIQLAYDGQQFEVGPALVSGA